MPDDNSSNPDEPGCCRRCLHACVRPWCNASYRCRQTLICCNLAIIYLLLLASAAFVAYVIYLAPHLSGWTIVMPYPVTTPALAVPTLSPTPEPTTLPPEIATTTLPTTKANFRDPRLQSTLPNGAAQTYQHLLRHLQKLAMLRKVIVTPVSRFDLALGYAVDCHNLSYSGLPPHYCAIPGFVTDIRYMFSPHLSPKGVKALIALADAHTYLNSSLDLPPVTSLNPNHSSPHTVRELLQTVSWKLVRHAHPSLFPTIEFQQNLPVVTPSRVFRPERALLLRHNPAMCVGLDHGWTYLCSDLPLANELHAITLYQWLEFTLWLLDRKMITLKSGPCDPQPGKSRSEIIDCPASHWWLEGTILTNGTSTTRRLPWRVLAPFASRLRCPRHVYPGPDHSQCQPRHFQRYERVFGYSLRLDSQWRDQGGKWQRHRHDGKTL